MRNKGLIFLLLGLFSLVMFGCGSSGDGSDPVPPPADGIVSDPYVYGAYFTEYDAAGKELQVSTMSSEQGNFQFPGPLTLGSTIVMNTIDGVRHVTPDGRSMAYNGPLLKLKVNAALAAGEEPVITPMTTLAAMLQGPPSNLSEAAAKAQIVELLNAAGCDGITAENVYDDPMASFEEGGSGDLALVRAALALSSALQFGLPDSGKFNDILRDAHCAIAMATTDDENLDLNDRLQAGAIIAYEILQKADGDTAASRAAELILWLESKDDEKSGADELIEKIVDAEEDGTAVVFDNDNDDDDSDDDDAEITLEDKNYQDLFDGYYDSAMASLDATIGGDLGLTASTDLVALANKFKSAKLVLADAASNKVPLTIAQNKLNNLNFFYAFSRIMLLANPLSDSNPDNGLLRLGDILDALGVATSITVRDENLGMESCEEVMNPLTMLLETVCTTNIFPDDVNGDPIVAETTPNTDQLQAFLYQQASIELQNAVDALVLVQDTFVLTQLLNGDIDPIEFDYTDVLFFKAYANGLLYQIAFQQGVDVSVDLKEAMQDTTETFETFLAAHPNLLKTTDAAALAKAREYAGVALKGLSAAIFAMEAEGDDQTDDFINFYDVDPIAQAEAIAQAKTDISQAMHVFYGNTTYVIDDKDVVVNLNALFSGTLSLRALLPKYTGDQPGMFPDPTLGGMASANLDLNADAQGDGTPDIIQTDVVKFTPAMFANRAYLVRAEMNSPAIVEFTGSTFEVTGATTVSGVWQVNADAQSLTLNDGEEPQVWTRVNGYLDNTDLLEFEISLDGSDIPSLFLDQLLPVSAFSAEMLANRHLEAASQTGGNNYLSVQLYGDFTYYDYLTYNGGTWSVVDGKLLLTPSGGVTATYAIIKGYLTKWDEGFFSLDLNGGSDTLSGNLYRW